MWHIGTLYTHISIDIYYYYYQSSYHAQKHSFNMGAGAAAASSLQFVIITFIIIDKHGFARAQFLFASSVTILRLVWFSLDWLWILVGIKSEKREEMRERVCALISVTDFDLIEMSCCWCCFAL